MRTTRPTQTSTAPEVAYVTPIALTVMVLTRIEINAPHDRPVGSVVILTTDGS